MDPFWTHGHLYGCQHPRARVAGWSIRRTMLLAHDTINVSKNSSGIQWISIQLTTNLSAFIEMVTGPDGFGLTCAWLWLCLICVSFELTRQNSKEITNSLRGSLILHYIYGYVYIYIYIYSLVPGVAPLDLAAAILGVELIQKINENETWEALCYFYVYFLFISSCNFGIQHTLTALHIAHHPAASLFKAPTWETRNLSPNGPYCLLARVQERRTGEDHCEPIVSFETWRSTSSLSRHHLILHFTGAEWLARGRGHADVRGWLVAVLTTVAAVAPSYNMEHLNQTQTMIEKHGYDNMTWLTMHWSLIASCLILLVDLLTCCILCMCKELQWLLAWSFLGLCCCSSRDFLAAKSQEPSASVGGHSTPLTSCWQTFAPSNLFCI